MRTKTPTAALPLRLPQNEYDALKSFATVTDKSMNEVAIQAIREYLTREDNRSQFDTLIDELAKKHRTALDKLADL